METKQHTEGIWFQHNALAMNPASQYRLPNRVNHATVYNPATDKIYILGGFYEHDELTSDNVAATLDCHEFDCHTQKVKLLKRAVQVTESELNDDTINYPFMRYGLSACLIGNSIYLYGGMSNASLLCRNRYHQTHNMVNVFRLDLATNEYSRVDLSQKVDFSDPHTLYEFTPGKRGGHSMVAVPNRNAFLVFGGFSMSTFNQLRADLWLFTIDPVNNTGAWKEMRVSPYADGPFARDFSSLQIIQDKLVLYGGRCTSNMFVFYDEKTWVIDDITSCVDSMTSNRPKSCEWKSPNSEPDAVTPEPRRSHMTFVRNGEFYIFGGADARQNHFSDMWKLNIDTMQWSEVSYNKQGLIPYGLRRGSLVYCAGLDSAYVLCGTRPPREHREREAMSKFGSAKDDLYDLNSFNLICFNPTLQTLAIHSLNKQIHAWSSAFYNSKDDIEKHQIQEIQNILNSFEVYAPRLMEDYIHTVLGTGLLQDNIAYCLNKGAQQADINDKSG